MEVSIMNHLLSLIAGFSMFSADASASSYCFMIFHEPKMPEAMKKRFKD
jgi:cyclic lactone autoinducer peptide